MSPFRVALTGGIASGKTTVANLFGEARRVVDRHRPHRTPGGRARSPRFAASRDHVFGTDILDTNGQLDRRHMRERIFADHDAKRGRLEAILHPAIRHEMETQSLAAGGPYQVLVIPSDGGGRSSRSRRPCAGRGRTRVAADRKTHCPATGSVTGAGAGLAQVRRQVPRRASRRGPRRDHQHGDVLTSCRRRYDALHHRYLAMSRSQKPPANHVVCPSSEVAPDLAVPVSMPYAPLTASMMEDLSNFGVVPGQTGITHNSWL